MIKGLSKTHSDKSRTQIYEMIKGTKVGTRKTTVLKWVREFRGKEAPGPQEREKFVPRKYRKKDVEIETEKRPPDYEYTLTKIRMDGEDFFIKSNPSDPDKLSYVKQVDRIRKGDSPPGISQDADYEVVWSKDMTKSEFATDWGNNDVR